MIYGREPRIPNQFSDNHMFQREEFKSIDDYHRFLLDTWPALRTQIAQFCEKNKVREKEQHDKYRKAAEFREGEAVLMRSLPNRPKFGNRFEGPHVIEKRTGPNNYLVNKDGKVDNFHVERLKKYRNRAEKPQKLNEKSSSADEIEEVTVEKIQSRNKNSDHQNKPPMAKKLGIEPTQKNAQNQQFFSTFTKKSDKKHFDHLYHRSNPQNVQYAETQASELSKRVQKEAKPDRKSPKDSRPSLALDYGLSLLMMFILILPLAVCFEQVPPLIWRQESKVVTNGIYEILMEIVFENPCSMVLPDDKQMNKSSSGNLDRSVVIIPNLPTADGRGRRDVSNIPKIVPYANNVNWLVSKERGMMFPPEEFCESFPSGCAEIQEYISKSGLSFPGYLRDVQSTIYISNPENAKNSMKKMIRKNCEQYFQ